MTDLGLYPFKPSERLPLVEISEVGTVFVGLVLERNLAIGLVPIPTTGQTDEPFRNVPKIKEEKERLLHLRCMNPLVVEHSGVWRDGLSDEEHAEKVDGIKTFDGDYLVSDYFHRMAFRSKSSK